MNQSVIQVTAGGRLHFGLFSFGPNPAGRNYGGAGMMIDRPVLRLRLSPAESFAAQGPLAHRVEKFANGWARATGLSELPGCHIQIETIPSEHSGLGVGTQLGLSVAAGLNELTEQPMANAERLAAQTGRGVRSAVGVYGFLHGGLIVDDGKLPDEKLSPLLHRCAIPDDWRVVLIRPAQGQGLSGTEERQAFEGAPAVDPRVSKSLRNEVAERMLPALAEGNFEGFSASVYRFGKTAGECFSAVQQGPYHGPLLTGIVETARNLGVTGVGQSSWGPTIYCLLPDAVSAAGFADKMKSSMTSADLECVIAQPCNLGAIVKKLKTVVPAR